jgi:hypothetical protein
VAHLVCLEPHPLSHPPFTGLPGWWADRRHVTTLPETPTNSLITLDSPRDHQTARIQPTPTPPPPRHPHSTYTHTHTYTHSPELQRALLLGIWPGLEPYLHAALDPSSTNPPPPPPPPPPAVAAAASAAAATPLAPFLHFDTTPGARRAEEEARLAACFAGAVLNIEVRFVWRGMEAVALPFCCPPSS